MKVTRKSMFSEKTRTIELDVTQAQIDRWRGGELIQKAMPHLSPSQREFLITGITAGEWEAMFPQGHYFTEEGEE